MPGVDLVFFQAEDGIRDLVRSRGLGDVYKRQGTEDSHGIDADMGAKGPVLHGLEGINEEGRQVRGLDPVSYTHLTLPTSDLV